MSTGRAPAEISVILTHPAGQDPRARVEHLLVAVGKPAHYEVLVEPVDPPRAVPPSRIAEEEAANLSLARNRGLDRAQGKHVVFLDSRDHWSPGFLDALVATRRLGGLPCARLEWQQESTAPDTVPPTPRPGFETVCGMLVPLDWLAGHRFDTGLGTEAERTLVASVSARFPQRYAEIDVAPARAGATYWHHPPLAPTGDPSPEERYRAGITQPLAVLRTVTAPHQRNPLDRLPRTQEVCAEMGRRMDTYLRAHPHHLERAHADFRVDPVTGFEPTGGFVPPYWPDYRMVGDPPAWKPGLRILIRAGSAEAVRTVREPAQWLQRLGNRIHVQLAHPYDPGVQDDIGLDIMPATSLHDVTQEPDLVISLAGNEVGEPEHAGVGALHAQVMALAASRPRLGRSQVRLVTDAAKALRAVPIQDPWMPPARVWAILAYQLHVQGYLEAADALASQAMTMFPDAGDHGFAAIRALAATARTASLPEGTEDVARATMQAADTALGDEDVPRAAFLSHVVMSLLLHPEVQTNVADPMLLRKGPALLAPVEGSRVWQVLQQSSRPPAVEPPAIRVGGHRLRVLLLPGAYPRFAQPVQEAFESVAEVRTLRLADLDSTFGGISTSAADLRRHMEAVLQGDVDLDARIRGAFQDVDVVFADWADKGAVVASRLAPPGARLFIRFHGADSLDRTQFLIDWSRVTDVVFVSDHLRRSAGTVLGQRLAHARIHVLGHGIDVDRFAPSATTASSTRLGRRSRTLGMVGWGQQVKDPLWTLEVLGRLRRTDPSWRLKLVGADLPNHATKLSEARCAEAFRRRALEPGLVGAIEYVGYTTDLPRHLGDIGFAISSSLRESWHIGAVEMVAAGAIPVIRDWPVYAPWQGAASLFGADWTVASVDEAVERILAHADPHAWHDASQQARARVRAKFPAEAAAARYRALLA